MYIPGKACYCICNFNIGYRITNIVFNEIALYAQTLYVIQCKQLDVTISKQILGDKSNFD